MIELEHIDKKWEQEIKLAMPLKELQTLYMCIVNVSYTDFQSYCKEEKLDCPMTFEHFERIIQSCERILKNNNGYIIE